MFIHLYIYIYIFRYLGIYYICHMLSSYHLNWLHVDSAQELHQGILVLLVRPRLLEPPKNLLGFPFSANRSNRARKWISVGPSLAMMKKTWILIAGKVWSGDFMRLPSSRNHVLSIHLPQLLGTFSDTMESWLVHAKACLLAKVDLCLHHLQGKFAGKWEIVSARVGRRPVKTGNSPIQSFLLLAAASETLSAQCPTPNFPHVVAIWYEMSSPALPLAWHKHRDPSQTGLPKFEPCKAPGSPEVQRLSSHVRQKFELFSTVLSLILLIVIVVIIS